MKSEENTQNLTLTNIKKFSYETLRELAKNETLSIYEKIGFPDSYRNGFEPQIFHDITSKLTNLNQTHKTVLDIGPGCSEIPSFLIKLCDTQQHKLVFSDSEEMLAFHQDRSFLYKVPGMFPKTYEQVCKIESQYDVILCYSVLPCIFVDMNVWDFVDTCLSLLKPGGQLLLGDIPNISKRKRFFASEAGIAFHKKFMNTQSLPEVKFNTIEAGKIDDAIILSIILRAQNSGFDAYLMPQGKDLPMENRRDDILIVRP